MLRGVSTVDELYVTPADLKFAINQQTLAACFDDGSGGVDTAALLFVLRRATDRCRGFLPRAYLASPAGSPAGVVPAGVRNAAIEYAVCFAHERHPEFVRAFPQDEHERRLARADRLMEKIATGAEYLADSPPAALPATVGGLVYDSGERVVVDSPDGTRNRGDW